MLAHGALCCVFAVVWCTPGEKKSLCWPPKRKDAETLLASGTPATGTALPRSTSSSGVPVYLLASNQTICFERAAKSPPPSTSMQQNRLQLHVNGLHQPGPDSRRRCSGPERLRAPTITKPFFSASARSETKTTTLLCDSSAPLAQWAPTITKPFLFPKFALRLCRDLGL